MEARTEVRAGDVGYIITGIKNAKEVKDLLWPHSDDVISPWTYNNEETYSAIELSQHVLNEINNQVETPEEALKGWIEYSDGAAMSIEIQELRYLEKDLDELWNDRSPEAMKKCDEIYKEMDEIRSNLRKNLLSDFYDKAIQRFGDGNYQVFTFEFSDNDGNIFSVLEHGNTFVNLPHIKVSRH